MTSTTVILVSILVKFRLLKLLFKVKERWFFITVVSVAKIATTSNGHKCFS